jgi:hypothetical protein
MSSMIIGYGPPLSYLCYVPDYAVDSNQLKIDKEGTCGPIAEDKYTESPEFDLPDSKWFAFDHGNVVRFPKDKEWDWRTRRAQEIVKIISTNPGFYKNAEERMLALESSAMLCGFNLIDLVSRLEKARQDNESLEDVFKRIKNERT